MKKVGLLFITIAVLLLSTTAHAERTIWYVHPDSSLNTIQAGLDSCANNDIVLVGPGTYYENVLWPNTQGIHLISEFGPDTTIIDGSYPTTADSGSVIAFVSGQDTNSVLRGFFITNGSGTVEPPYGSAGGGIYCHNNSSPTITGNTIDSNTAIYGGGITCYINCSPIITGNTITNNTADTTAGGIECSDNCSPLISGNIITGNDGYDGGGITCGDTSSAIIANNTITDNTARWGGGIVSNYSSPLITGNTITGNEAYQYGGGIDCYGSPSPIITGNTITDNTAPYGAGIRCYGSAPTIDSCTVANNTGDGIYCMDGSEPVISYCNIYGHAVTGVANITSYVTVNAENNWWGHPSGPWHAMTNPGGQGNAVSDYVDFVPWDTVPYPWGIEEYEPSEPIVIALQISPNPFRDKVSITFSTEYNMEAMAFTVYDATGRVVKEFNHLTNNHIFWNGADNFNRRLPSGVYFLKLEAGDYSATEKVLLIK